MRLKFCGAAQTVTGSAILVTAKDQQVLIDCVALPGSKLCRSETMTVSF